MHYSLKAKAFQRSNDPINTAQKIFSSAEQRYFLLLVLLLHLPWLLLLLKGLSHPASSEWIYLMLWRMALGNRRKCCSLDAKCMPAHSKKKGSLLLPKCILYHLCFCGLRYFCMLVIQPATLQPVSQGRSQYHYMITTVSDKPSELHCFIIQHYCLMDTYDGMDTPK